MGSSRGGLALSSLGAAWSCVDCASVGGTLCQFQRDSVSIAGVFYGRERESESGGGARFNARPSRRRPWWWEKAMEARGCVGEAERSASSSGSLHRGVTDDGRLELESAVGDMLEGQTIVLDGTWKTQSTQPPDS